MYFIPLPCYLLPLLAKYDRTHSLPNFVPLKNVRTFKRKLLELQQFTPLGSDIGSVDVRPMFTSKSHCLVVTCFPHEALSAITFYYSLDPSSLPKVIKDDLYPLIVYHTFLCCKPCLIPPMC